MNIRQLRLVHTSISNILPVVYFIAVIPPHPLVTPDENHHTLFILVNILFQLIHLLSTTPPLVSTNLTLRDRLFPDFHGHDFQGCDVFDMIYQQRYLFWLNTGETPESILNTVYQVGPHLAILNRRGQLSRHIGRYKLNMVNRMLLVFIWLRKYPHLDTLALLFDVSPQTIQALLYQGILVLWRHFRRMVSWPTVQEWNALRNTWDEFPDALGSIDVTPHEINIPSTEPQRQFYNGHRHYHLLNTQLICDNQGHIRYLQAGFLGSTHDSLTFRFMEPIGPGLSLDFPVNAFLLADKGYPDVQPLLTPFRQAQIRRLGRRDRRRAVHFNRELSRKRVKVEHIFKYLKDYNCVAGIWRQERWFLPIVVELCVFLAERHITLFEQL